MKDEFDDKESDQSSKRAVWTDELIASFLEQRYVGYASKFSKTSSSTAERILIWTNLTKTLYVISNVATISTKWILLCSN